MTKDINFVMHEILKLTSPEKIYLYNKKVSPAQALTSFKLCVITPTDDKEGLEKQIYISVDCDIPYDILIYTPDEWRENSNQEHSFANKIKNTGEILYG